MTKWNTIDKDIDITNGSVMGATFAMKVPGGMIIRNVMNGGATTMVFVPMEEQMVGPNRNLIDVWIEQNKVL